MARFSLMRDPDIHRGRGSAIPVLAYLSLAIAAAVFLLASVLVTGTDIIRIYLRSPYRHYPVLAFCASGTIIILNLILAVFRAVNGSEKRACRAPGWALVIAPLLTVAYCSAAALYIRTSYLRVSGGPASAPSRFWAGAGPFVQFGPFLGRRADAATGAAIWYFDPFGSDQPALLLYGTNPEPGRMFHVKEASGDGRRHQFHLTGLSPGTRYYYRIAGHDDAIRSFRTAPSGAQPVRFLCMGDTGNTRRGGYGHSYYRDILRAASSWYGDRGPDFTLHAGDLVRTGADLDGWHQFLSSTELISGRPLLVAPGNHEFLKDRGANFRYFFGQPDYFSVDYGDARILCIYAFDGPGKTLDGPVLSTGADQYRWVKNELAREREGKWLIILLHIPILSTGDYGSNDLLIEQYFELFREQRVDLVIAGHDHDFDSFHVDRGAPWGGTIYLVTGTGGSHLDSYIMNRPNRRWLGWRHDRTSTAGLYQHDAFTRQYHEYGELSWGFTDVDIRGDTMTVTYCRWLDFNRFLSITGQDARSWDMVYLDEETIKKYGLDGAIAVRTIRKSRKN
ncbi:MAG: metallophosphoesterase [Spirochaetes bacterium]|nr:metallophosphoesterase [Spirochaetota bacterium]